MKDQRSLLTLRHDLAEVVRGASLPSNKKQALLTLISRISDMADYRLALQAAQAVIQRELGRLEHQTYA